MSLLELKPTQHQQKLSVLVPVHNLGDSILENIQLLISEIEPYFQSYEVLIISNGSTDETNQKLRAFQHPKCRMIIIPETIGKGNSIRRGFFEAQGEYILFIDGGMELHPREIRIFFGLMSLYDADIVLGSKRHPQSEIEYPLIRRFLSGIYQMMLRYFFDLDVTDTQVGLKLFKRKVVEDVRELMEVGGYGFDLEVLALAKLKGHGKMLEAPVRLDYFDKNRRRGLAELLHVFRVGWSVMADTMRVYRKVIHLRKERADWKSDQPGPIKINR